MRDDSSMDMRQKFYSLFPSGFGSFSIVWQEAQGSVKIIRIFLPNKQASADDMVHKTFVDVEYRSSSVIEELGKKIQHFLEGKAVNFDLDIIALERCSEFQKRVLLAEYKIPRSWVSTYGRIAKHLGIPNGARAVGRAFSTNPFPIIIPCHRAIRNDGQLGGFQGGLEMKRALLRLEDVEFSGLGTVITSRIFY